MFKLLTRPWFGLAFIAVLCCSFLFAEAINHRLWLSDFEVYYKAAYRLIHSQNLYRHPEDGHYIFKYSPVSALIFIPFTLFPFEIAKVIYWFFLTGIIVLNFYISVKLLTPKIGLIPTTKQLNIIYMTSAVVLALHFLRELHLGQVNYVLLFMYVLALTALVSNRNILSSVIISLSIFIKPFGLIFIPYLAYRKKFKSLLILGISFIIWSLIPLIFYHNWHLFIDQYYAWFKELGIEMGHKQDLLANANHTIFSVFARMTPLRFVIAAPEFVRFYQLSLLMVLLYFFYKAFHITQLNHTVERTTLDFYLIIGFIPLLAFTSENAFIFEQLLIVLILYYFNLMSRLEKVIAILAFILVGGNFAELLGHNISNFADNNSLVSIGSILLIFLFVKLVPRFKQSLVTE